MLPTLNSIITVLTLTAPLLIIIVFLPALVELKKPKDNGPRMIMENASEFEAVMITIIPLANIEENRKFDVALIRTLSRIIEVLPSLEI